jgi:TrmH family RNA methyltransferase
VYHTAVRPDVTSRHHRIVQAFKSAAQREGGLALLDGWHLLHEAAGADVEITAVAISQRPSQTQDEALIDRLARRAQVISVSASVMDALSPVRTPTGVVAIVQPHPAAFVQLLTPAPALVVVAIDVQDPGNAGAIVRAAEAGGATGVILAGESADPWGWKALRAAMGSTFRLPVMREPQTTAALNQLRQAHVRLLATVPRGGVAMHDADFRVAAALLLGSEGAGLAELAARDADARISIPMKRPVESLNVAVAAGILVYEAGRQRQSGR